MKIVTVVGARPQFIKAAVVSRQIKLYNQSASEDSLVSEYLVHTGQHYDRNMSEIFFEEMEIPRPDTCLDIHGLSHGAMTGRMIERIESVLLAVKPDVVLVYGDTNSTLAGALAAVKLHIPVAHVEAGLRSFNRMMPEEHNRVLADHVSTFLFCPTETAVENLKREGISGCPVNSADPPATSVYPQVFRVGDVMYDAALFYAKRANNQSRILEQIFTRGLSPQSYALVTLHRAENTDSAVRLRSIIESLELISRELPIVWPLHPRTNQKMREHSLHVAEAAGRISLIDPVGYFDMIELVRNSRLVLTDSGGLQKEAYFFKRPCVTLREETEWVELVEHGFNKIAGVTSDGISATFHKMLTTRPDFNLKLYGNGDAGEKILATFLRHLPAYNGRSMQRVPGANR